jgi:hypothetical protein
VLAAAKAGAWSRVGGDAVEVGGQVIRADEYELRFKAAEGLDAVSFDGSAGVVVLDTHVDADLEREGLARDFIRLVQVARKDAGFNVADRIRIEVQAGPAGSDAIAARSSGSRTIWPLPQTRSVCRTPGTTKITATLRFSTMLRNESIRLLPGRSGIAIVRSSRIFTKPAGSPFGDTSGSPRALAVASMMNGLAAMKRAQCSSRIGTTFCAA